MSDIPERVRTLLEQREVARAAKEYARADALREQIDRLGFEVHDAPGGAIVEPRPPYTMLDPSSIPEQLTDPPSLTWSVTLLYEGFLDDLERFLRGFEQHHDTSEAEVVIVDNGSEDAARIEALVKPRTWVKCLHLARALGWAAARNVCLRCSRGRLIAIVDLSVEPTGDILTPLKAALEEPDVVLAGPYGLVSDDMQSWRETTGPDAAAIEGYLMATTREHLALAGGFTERFDWYRNADLDLSFGLRAEGSKPARVVGVPIRKHEHRGWSSLDAPTREQRSRRNYRVFLDRWRERPDLLV